MDFISFKGTRYPTVTISLPEGIRTISTTALNDTLMNAAGGYVSDQARRIDEKLFFFVEEDDLKLLKSQLVLLILAALCYTISFSRVPKELHLKLKK